MLTAVKFCGMCRAADAAAGAEAGARYVGVILSRVGPRSQTVASAAAIYGAATGALRVGVFVDEPVARVREVAGELGLDVIQLHGAESLESVAALRGRTWRIWKAVRPRDTGEFLAGLMAWKGRVDGIVVDGWTASGAGGKGTPFPWAAVELHRGRVPAGLELVVAGGLVPENVGDAVRRLRPDVVDVSSGVEAERCVKSDVLMRRFVTAVREAENR
jgi:phosphoribosylanthranilate isomerase